MISAHFSRRALVAGLAFLLVAAALVSMPSLAGERVEQAVADVSAATHYWLWLAGLAFVGALVCGAGGWRAALRLCDGRVSLQDSCARYGAGSLASTFVPGGAGGAVRIALYSRALEGKDRLWTTGGVSAAVSAARTVVLGFLLAYAFATGALPAWPLLLVGGAVLGVSVAVWISRRRAPRGHVAHVLDAFRGLARNPRAAASLLGWMAGATAMRVTAAAAIAAAFGVDSPLSAALIIIPALAVTTLAPLTPANVGLSSGAVMVALHARGVDSTTALSAGIALNAVETMVSIAFGLSGVLYLARFPSLRVRRWTLSAVGSAAALAVAAAVITTA